MHYLAESGRFQKTDTENQTEIAELAQAHSLGVSIENLDISSAPVSRTSSLEGLLGGRKLERSISVENIPTKLLSEYETLDKNILKINRHICPAQINCQNSNLHGAYIWC